MTTTSTAAMTAERTSPTCVRMTFDRPVTLDEAWGAAEGRNYFGYHPAGYMGAVALRDATQEPSATVADYTHSLSCD